MTGRRTASALAIGSTLLLGCAPAAARPTPSAPPPAAADVASATVSSTASCMDRGPATITFSGPQVGRYEGRYTTPAHAIIDASTATWRSDTSGSPLRVGNADSICWHGGTITGQFSDDMRWSAFHDTYAFVGYGSHMVVEDLRAHNFGDGIKWLEDKTVDWTVRRVHLSHMHDDCVETDWAQSGRIEDVLFEGCYVFLASRPNPYVTGAVGGANDTIVVDGAVVWMEPMKTVYSGASPSTSAIFKVARGRASQSPSMRLRNVVLRVDLAPGVGDACLNPKNLVVESVNNVVVWLGSGDYPCLPLPSGWTLTRDKSVYDDAVAQWKARHPRAVGSLSPGAENNH